MDPSHASKESTIVVKTVCHRDCPDTCFVDAIVEDGKITSTRGSKENPVTQGFLCPRGIGDPKRVYSTERVLHPYLKDGNEFRRVPWSEAIDLVAGKLTSVLENFGSESVLHYDYPGNQGFLAWQYPERLWRSLGATVTDGALCAPQDMPESGSTTDSPTDSDSRMCSTVGPSCSGGTTHESALLTSGRFR